MEQKNINFLILAFVFLIVGSALIVSIATATNDVVDKQTVSNESVDVTTARIADSLLSYDPTVELTLANAPAGWEQSDCPITDFVIRNQTGSTATVTTDYVLTDSRGVITLVNSSFWHSGTAVDTVIQPANITTVDYTYCDSDYLNSGWGRAVITTVPGFFALALLGVALWLFYMVFQGIGLIKR